MMSDAERRAALQANLRFYRDLGIYDLYSRGEGELPSWVKATDAVPPQRAVVQAQAAAQREAPVRPSSLAQPRSTSAVALGAVPPINPVAGSRVPAPASSGLSQAAGLSPAVPRTPAVAVPLVPPIGEPVAPDKRAEAMQAIRADIGDCTRCALSQGRNKIVFGDGDVNARLMFVGEGPGADEDAQGLPFVGKAGQLLNNMIAAMGLKREQVYIANVVKCRPPQNRVPEPDEAHTCMQFLYRQIDVVRPEVMVALGATAATYLMGARSPLGSLRGKLHACRGAKLIVTYHPAFLLRDPRQKGEAWKDLQIAMKELGLAAPKKG